MNRALIPPTQAASDRRDLRRELRARRRALSPREQRLAATALARRLLQLPRVSHASRMGAYTAAGSELSLQCFLEHCAIERVALPQVVGTHMRFLPASAPKRRHHLGFEEPYGRRPWAIWSMSVILVPLLGFDAAGNRMGQGGGHYDRALARLRPRRPWLLGIAHDVQELEHVPTQTWDIPLDGIITPTRTILIQGT
ncbi:5-formyltetrahydrofolate cyclo-ligase [Oceanococcus atlanticus]|nr:5-formyltetrahydrofolate cyclo-ligase [Oceanococcus atlanticus]